MHTQEGYLPFPPIFEHDVGGSGWDDLVLGVLEMHIRFVALGLLVCLLRVLVSRAAASAPSALLNGQPTGR